jgi:hypothetical protein
MPHEHPRHQGGRYRLLVILGDHLGEHGNKGASVHGQGLTKDEDAFLIVVHAIEKWHPSELSGRECCPD